MFIQSTYVYDIVDDPIYTKSNQEAIVMFRIARRSKNSALAFTSVDVDSHGYVLFQIQGQLCHMHLHEILEPNTEQTPVCSCFCPAQPAQVLFCDPETANQIRTN